MARVGPAWQRDNAAGRIKNDAGKFPALTVGARESFPSRRRAGGRVSRLDAGLYELTPARSPYNANISTMSDSLSDLMVEDLELVENEQWEAAALAATTRWFLLS